MKFYRYITREYAVLDRDGEFTSPSIPNPKLICEEYSLVKETPKGYWICYGNPFGLKGFDKWVSKTSKKRFAYPTKEEALINLITRSKVRERILKKQLDSTKSSIWLGENELKKIENL